MSGPCRYLESVKCLSTIHEPIATAARAISGPMLWSENPTNTLGNAFCKNIKENWGYNIEDNLAYPVAVGLAGLHFKIPLEQLVIAYLQSFVANLCNIGVKHIPLGQSAGQKILIELIPIVKDQALLYKECQINDLGSSAFISDLSSMFHETLKNRIYQT